MIEKVKGETRKIEPLSTALLRTRETSSSSHGGQTTSSCGPARLSRLLYRTPSSRLEEAPRGHSWELFPLESLSSELAVWFSSPVKWNRRFPHRNE
ncbi:hypothetical protein RRG08_024702 [Elysia crispata]|uniref:Uncharacterized protein n=1 Tax=Elysia crispata TaxID=231223 RepID=A0AAE0YDG8_9GAST|nr:hypothetical protein RRG08_024702 [Elysia crispata]